MTEVAQVVPNTCSAVITNVDKMFDIQLAVTTGGKNRVALVRHLLRVGLSVGICLAVGCDVLPPRNACPADLIGIPQAGESSLKWGGTEAKVSATIGRVLVECIPSTRANSATPGRTDTTYEIAATASVQYAIFDEKFYDQTTRYRNLDAGIIFEAKSTSGVVIGMSNGSMRIVRGNETGNSSSKIMGLTPEEIRRVAHVTARWDFGR